MQACQAFVAGLPAQDCQVGIATNLADQLFAQAQQFVDTGAPVIARLPALIATSGLIAGFTYGRRRFTGPAQCTYQALGHDPDQSGFDQVRRNTQLKQAADGAAGVVGVQGG
ncbi:hypothetical protein D3C75_1070730 [compost metagenome]